MIPTGDKENRKIRKQLCTDVVDIKIKWEVWSGNKPLKQRRTRIKCKVRNIP